MRSNEQFLASAAHHVAERRLASWAATVDTAVRRGPGWLAVRTGADSNDLNGLVVHDDGRLSPRTVHDVIGWLSPFPASWLIHRPSARMTNLLLAAGLRPERSGRWSGRLLPAATPHTAAVEIRPVRTVADLDHWLDVAATCGWTSSAQDRRARQVLYQSLSRRNGHRYWIALDGDTPTAFASSYLHGHVLELSDLGVLPSHRRRGIGRALVAARLAAARHRGVTVVVSAPSPEGWQLQQRLGFRSVPVIPDRCFYLPPR